MNPRQPATLQSNSIQNAKNNKHCMEVTIQGGKQTIDSYILYVVDIDTRKDIYVTKGSREHKKVTEKEEVVIDKVFPLIMPRLSFIKD